MVQLQTLLLVIEDCNLFKGRGQKFSGKRMKTAKEIQRDFDRIALAEGVEGWNHNNHYHDFLLRHTPPHLTRALEVGCGKGEFARLLAQRSEQVLGIDLSPEMLRIARLSSAQFPNIEYLQAD